MSFRRTIGVFLRKTLIFATSKHVVMEYRKSIVGREHEQDILQMCLDSNRAEFIAVYGRRRIGKTYLVKQFFQETFDFYAFGIYKMSRAEQLKRWQVQLQRHSGASRPRPKDWFEAFDQLRDYLESLKEKEKIVVFIDELPWMDTPKSGFIRALEVFWNSWASDCKALKLIVCGSATTWMTNKLLGDKGGLHNRVTRPIRLAPFTLKETQCYLNSLGLDWERQQILDAYMVMGGTPYYLSLLRPDLSLEQNVDELFFGNDPVLRTEYDFLFSSLFNSAVSYRRVVELLATKLKGMTRMEMIEELGIHDNGNLTEILNDLVKCDFLRRYQAYGKKEQDMLYQLTDMYTLFYLRYVKDYNGMNERAWSEMASGKRNVWAGYAFELTCILHLNQIKKALGINGIASDVCSWSLRNGKQGAQIDLVIDRSDKVINLCEIKYSDCRFELTKDYADWMKQRRELFREKTGTNKTIHLTLITPNGLVHGKHSPTVQSTVNMDDLFL